MSSRKARRPLRFGTLKLADVVVCGPKAPKSLNNGSCPKNSQPDWSPQTEFRFRAKCVVSLVSDRMVDVKPKPRGCAETR